jgi:predicted DsbA family dithiol-disulfide isomerase
METLMKAAKDGGLNEKEVKEYLESGEDSFTIKNKIRMVDGHIDGVPYVVICGTSDIVQDSHPGRKRDFTVQGAVEEEKYIKTFIQVDKEFS